MASIHLAYEEEPNHERIGPNSFACMQATPQDLERLGQQQLDPGADVVTLIFDVVTDKRNFHLVKPSSAADLDDLEKQVNRVLPAHSAI